MSIQTVFVKTAVLVLCGIAMPVWGEEASFDAEVSSVQNAGHAGQDRSCGGAEYSAEQPGKPAAWNGQQRTAVTNAVGANGMQPVGAVSSSSEEVEVSHLVSGFYETYCKAGGERPLSEFPELARSYLAKIDAMTTRFVRKNPDFGGLDFDPILWAQDVPGKITVVSAQVAGNAALVTLGSAWDPDQAPSSFICVSVSKGKNGWHIIDTYDPRLSGKKDCSSWKPGGLFPEW